MEWKKKLKRISVLALALILICNMQGTSQFVVHAETSGIVEKSVEKEGSTEEIQTEENNSQEEIVTEEGTNIAGNNEEISTENTEEKETEGISKEEITEEEITEEEITEEETTEEETTEEIEVSFQESITIDGIEIKVAADEGVFPKGATLSVHKLTDQSDTKKIKEAIREEINSEGETAKEVKDTTSFDITILDADGNEVQPDTDKGDVHVTFENINTTAVDKADTKVQVFHMEDDLNSAEQISSDVDTGEGTVAIKAEHFSVYVIAVTKEKTETEGGTYLITTQEDSYIINTGENEKYTNATLQEIMDYIIKDSSQSVTMGGNTVKCLGDNTPTIVFGAEDGNTTVINTEALSLTGVGMDTTTVTMEGSYSGGAITCENMTLLLPEEAGTDKNTVTLSGTLTLNAGAELNIAGGTIETAAECGIQMSGTDAKFRMSGGTIKKVLNEYFGYVVYATGSSDIQMTGGTINGGGACAFDVVNDASGKVELLGGTITTNNSSAISFFGNSRKDDVIIGKEDSTGPIITCKNNAAIYFRETSRKLLIQGGTIKAEREDSPAIFFSVKGALVITGGTIISQCSGAKTAEGTIFYNVENSTVSVSGNAKVENTGTGSAIHTYDSSARVTILGHASVTAASGPAIHCVDSENVFIGANATVTSAGGTVYHSDSGINRLFYTILINDLQQGNIKSINFSPELLNFTDIAEPGYCVEVGTTVSLTLSPAEGCSLTEPTVTGASGFKKDSVEDYGVINQDLTFSLIMPQNTVTISAKALLPNPITRVTGAALDSTYTGSAVTHSKDDLFTWKGTSPLTLTYYTANTGAGVKTGSTGDTTSGAATEGGAPKNAGTYYMKASVAADGTYQAVETEYMEFYIVPAKVTYTGITSTGKIYDGTTDATAANINTSSIAYTGVASADAPDVSLAISNIAFDNKNAGNTTLSFSAALDLTGSAVGNYVLAPSYVTGSVPATITEKTLQVKVKDGIKIELGDTLLTLGINDVTITGYVNNENESVLEGELQYKILGGTDNIGGTIMITLYGFTSSNYSFYYSFKSFSVNTKYFNSTPYTITGSNNGKIGSDLWYNGAITIKPNVYSDNFKYISISTNGTDWSTWGTEVALTTENTNGTIQIKLATGVGGSGVVVTSGDSSRSDLVGFTYRLDTTAPAYPEAPDGIYGIKVSTSWWRTLLNTLTFDHFWKGTQTVTVTAKEDGSGIEQTYFYKVRISDKASYIPLTEAELEQIPTTSWETSCTLEADDNYVVYAYTVDKARNKSAYICTAGMVLDTTAPSINSAVTENLLDVTTNLNVTAQDAGSGVKEYYVYCSETALETANKSATYVKNNKTTKSTTSTIIVSGLTANTTYYYYIVAEDQAGNSSAVKEGTFKTTLTQPTNVVPPTATAKYGTKVSEMPLSGGSAKKSDGNTTLPGTWSFTDADQSDYPAAGTNKSYEVTFTPTDSAHYASITITIKPTVTPIVPTITVTNSSTNTYTGSTIVISAATVTGATFPGAETPTGAVNYTYYTNATCTNKTAAIDGAAGEGQAPKYVGTYYVKASIAAKGSYKAAESKIAVLTIGKATPTYDTSIVSNLLLAKGKSLGDVTLPNGFSWESSVDVITVQNTVGTVKATVSYNPDSANYTTITGIVVSVAVKEPYTITVNNGMATINGSTVTTALEGQSVTITANAAPVEKEFNNWTVTGATPVNTTVATTTFVMGTENVTVAANYKEKEDGSNSSGGSSSGNSSAEGSLTSGETSKITPQPVTEALQQVTPAQNPAMTPQKQTEIETAAVSALAEKKPFIKGKEGKEGWDAIAGDMEEDEEGDTINIDMNGSTVLPKDILKSLQGRDITVVLDMGDGILWKITGKDIAAGELSDINLAITKGISNIPVDVISNVSGERDNMEITLAYDGEFGFTARLSINMDKKNAGLYANLFYYNEKTGELEFMNYGKLDENGNADLTFTHASEYIIVVDKKPMDGSITEDDSTSDDYSQTGDKGIVVKTTDETANTRMTVFIIVGIMVVVIGGIVIYAVKKKKEKEDITSGN